MRIPLGASFIFLAVLAAAAQTRTPDKSSAEFADSTSEMRGYIDRYTADRGSLQRYYVIELSSERREHMKKFYQEWIARVEAVNFDAMRQDGKVDYLLLRNHIRHELRLLDLEAGHQAAVASFVPFSDAIINLENARRRMEQVDVKKAAAMLSELTKQVTALNGKAKDAPRTVANRAAAEVIALRATLKHWFDYYNRYDPLFTWWTGESYRTADAALQDYAIFLREQVAGVRGAAADVATMAASPAPRRTSRRSRPSADDDEAQQPPPVAPPSNTTARMSSADDIIGEPIGREGLIAELENEMIPYSPEELIAIANKEFVWCEAEMKKASREMGNGEDWRAALERVKNMYVEPGKQPTLVRDLEREAEAFLDEHDLVTIPPLARETWRMEMMSPERQLVNPFFTGGETMSVSYPVDSMTFEQKLMSMRGNNIPFSRATVFHELIPGHELQGFMADRYRPYRDLFRTPFLIEGWSLYWELLLWDLKFQKTPEDRVGALFWRMHRCARIIFSLNFHLGKMTPLECVNLLVERVGHERDNAIGEVRRSLNGSYTPLYQAAYLLGGMQIYALHKELVDAGRMTNRQFHDAVLKQGRIPVEMIRASLAGQKIERGFTTNWKFYGPVTP